MNKLLHIITNNVPDQDNVLYIDTSNDNSPYLAYKETVEGDVKKVISIIEGDSYDRPVHCSELFKLLLFMNPGAKFVTKENDLYYRFPDDSQESLIPTLFPSDYKRNDPDAFNTETDLGLSAKAIRAIKVCDQSLDDGKGSIEEPHDYSYFEKKVEETIGELMDNTGTRSVGSYSVDLLENSRVIELVNGTLYTDTINFNELMRKVQAIGISCVAEVSVSYTILDIIYKGSFTFKPFEYISDDTIEVRNMISKIGDDKVQAEYFNGILRVIPVSSEINECIIDNCTVTYGNL